MDPKERVKELTQILNDANGTWSYIGGQLVSAVG